ncbi:MAG: TetR/AcrR family transcriptional regulator [Patulibacter sp.]|nr:TetR/AcrR family transcriptional regulator [Patulibacter sp.]
MGPRVRPTPHQQQGERSRREALAAARTLLATRGYTGMTVSQLCKHSGLSPGSVYWHFGSKEGVLAAVVEQGVQELLAKVPKPSDFEGSPIERFDQITERIAQVVEEEPESLKLLLTLTLQEDGDEQVRRVVAEMRERALRSWEESLRPLLAPDGDADGLRLVEAVALLGRAVADGALIRSVAEGDGAVIDIFRTFVTLLRPFAR